MCAHDCNISYGIYFFFCVCKSNKFKQLTDMSKQKMYRKDVKYIIGLTKKRFKSKKFEKEDDNSGKDT